MDTAWETVQQENGRLLRVACFAVKHAAIFDLDFIVLHFVVPSLCPHADAAQHESDDKK